MSPIKSTVGVPSAAQIEADFWLELAEISAESMGWIALDDCCYLHSGSDELVIEVVGQATVGMAQSNLIWLY